MQNEGKITNLVVSGGTHYTITVDISEDKHKDYPSINTITGTLSHNVLTNQMKEHFAKINITKYPEDAFGMPVKLEWSVDSSTLYPSMINLHSYTETKIFMEHKSQQIDNRSGKTGDTLIVDDPAQQRSYHGHTLPIRSADVVKVIDGDTIVVMIGDKEEIVRLIGVDTPESKEPGGPEATAFTRKYLAPGAVVKLDTCTHQSNKIGEAGHPLNDGEFHTGRDKYGRLLAIVYFYQGGPWINLSKTLLRNGHGVVWNTDDARFIQNQGYPCPRTAEWERYVRDFVAQELTRDTGEDILSNINDLPRQDDRTHLLDYSCRIGDVQFLVPPTSIKIVNQKTNEQISAIRSKGSVKKATGHGEKVIELEIYFHSKESINGTPVSKGNNIGVKIPSGETYYINGLRSLIAQFKRSPFLPIDNEFINFTHNIFAVTLQNITVETVQGFPNNLVARVTMLKFNWNVYMPGEADFGAVFNWPLYRFYYQDGLLSENSNSTPRLKKLTDKPFVGGQDVIFSIVEEDDLIKRQEATRKLEDMEEPSISDIEGGYSHTTMAQEARDHDKIIEALRQKELYEYWVRNPAEYIQEYYIPNGGESQGPLIHWTDFHNISDVLFFEDKERLNKKYNITELPEEPGQIIVFNLESARNREDCIEVLEWLDSVATIPKQAIFIDTTKGVRALNNISQRGRAAKDKLNKSVKRDLESAESEYNKTRDMAMKIESEMHMEEVIIEDLHLTSATISYENIITSLQVLDQDTPTHQYLGSQDIYIKFNYQTNNRDAIAAIQLLTEQASHIARNYRYDISSGFLSIKNELVQLFGVDSVLIDSVIVDTVPGNPELFNIEMMMVDFDKTQRTREELINLPGEPHNMSNAKTLDEMKDLLQSGRDWEPSDSGIKFESLMQQLEVYPDLELPTYDRVYSVLADLGIRNVLYSSGNAKFVDPDFYIGVTETFRTEVQEMISRDDISMSLEDLTVSSADGTPAKANTPMGQKMVLDSETEQLANSLGENLTIIRRADSGQEYSTGTVKDNPNSVSGKHAEVFSLIEGQVGLKNPYREVSFGDINQAINKTLEGDFRGNNLLTSGLYSYIGLLGKDKVLVAIKAIMEHESRWTQFIRWNKYEDETNYIIPLMGEKTPDLGLMQINPYVWCKGSGVGGLSPTEVNKVAWEYEYNIKKGIDIFLDGVYRIWTVAKIQDPDAALGWAIVVYNKGYPNADIKNRNIDDYKGEKYWKDVSPLMSKYEQNPAGTIIGGAITDTGKIRGYAPTGHETIATDYESGTFGENLGANFKTEDYDEGEPKQDLAEESFNRSFIDILKYDMRDRLARAFPTYQMFIVDEGRWLTWYRLWDNLYGFNSVSSIDVNKSRKMAADTCLIVLNNAYDNINRYDPNIRYDNYGFTFWHFISPWLSPTEEMIEQRRQALTQLFLKTGARIHLRMGYGSDASNLPVVFNGTITEMDVQDTVTIIAQGDGLELTNKLEAKPNETTGSLLAVSRNEPRNLIMWLLDDQTSWLERWTKEGILGIKINRGIVHYGNTTSKPYKIREPEIGQNVFTAIKASATVDPYRDIPQAARDWLWLPPTIDQTDEPNISIFMYDKTPWDIMQVCAMAIPDYIVASHPFELRSTLYYGKPYWGLAYKYAYDYQLDSNGNLASKGVREVRKTFQQFRTYHSRVDIISNKIKASEDGVYTNVIGMWSTNKYDNPTKSTLVSADTDIYPEKQKTTMIHTELKGNQVFGTTFGIPQLANNVATSALVNSLKDMYKGSFTVLGDPAAKPFDECYLFDTYTEMAGNLEFEAVTHSMSKETGFVTNIIPDACINAIDPAIVNRWQWFASAGTGLGLSLTAKIANTGAAQFAAQTSLYVLPKPMLMFLANKMGLSLIPSTWSRSQIIHAVSVELAKKGGMTKLFSIKSSSTGAAILNKMFATKVGGAVKGTVGFAKVLGAKAVGTTILGATLLGPVVLAVAITGTLLFLSSSLLEISRRYLQNRQAVIINPLTRHGREFSAGINGHKGCVAGDVPGKTDKFINKYLGWLGAKYD